MNYRLGRELSAVCADEATRCWTASHLGAGPAAARRGRADVEPAFAGWEITDVVVADTEPEPIARLFKFDERFFRLRRSAATSATSAGV